MNSEIYDKITTKAICTNPKSSAEFTKAVKAECKKLLVKYSDFCSHAIDFQANQNYLEI